MTLRAKWGNFSKPQAPLHRNVQKQNEHDRKQNGSLESLNSGSLSNDLI